MLLISEAGIISEIIDKNGTSTYRWFEENIWNGEHFDEMDISRSISKGVDCMLYDNFDDKSEYILKIM